MNDVETFCIYCQEGPYSTYEKLEKHIEKEHLHSLHYEPGTMIEVKGHHFKISDGPVEIPSDPQNFDLDSFLDSLPGHLRMKIVQEKFGEPKATVTPIHRAEPTEPRLAPIAAPRPGVPTLNLRETAPGAPSWQAKALVGTLVGIALLLAYTALLVAWLVSKLVIFIASYIERKLNAG